MAYVCNKLKAGRKKTVFDLVDRGTQQLQEKRSEYGIKENKEVLTPLFVMWSRKKITQEEFTAGCYLEELNYKIKRAGGKFGGVVKSSLSKMQDEYVSDVRKNISIVPINEKCSGIMQEIRSYINCVHDKAMLLVDEIVMNQNLELMDKMLSMTNHDLAIFRKSLGITYEYMKANSSVGYVKAYHAKVG